MLANGDDRARLRAFSALGMLRDEPHLVTDRERLKPATHDAVAVEIDLLTRGTCDQSAILPREEPRDPPVVGHRMQFGVSASPTNVVFKQPAGSVESVADCDIDILMRVVRRGIAPDDNLVPGYFQVDSDPDQIALLAARVPALDDDAAGYDSVEKTFELLGAYANSFGDRVG
jgi:hypothetical protein